MPSRRNECLFSNGCLYHVLDNSVSDLEVIITHASRRKCENKITENCPVCVVAKKAWCATCMPVRRLGTPDCFGEQAHSSIDVGVLVLE